MKTAVFAAAIARFLCASIAVVAFPLAGCQVSPPAAHSLAREGIVRASTRDRAAEIAEQLDRLRPRVLALLPDARRTDLEVWIQDVPALYEFQTSAYSDADGFFAEDAHRIHLRDGSDHIERTLAHELVHASLGKSWSTLPGTLEEGLCDVVSAHLCPDAAARLSAGRLSSAAFATGGLVLDVDLAIPSRDRPGEHEVCWSARLRLDGDPHVRVDPLRAFEVKAGLSSSDLAPALKKAYYGIAFLVVSRIVERIGIEGLHALCAQASAEGLATIPVERLLAAAELGPDCDSFRAAIDEALGAPEIEELVTAHPEFLVSTIVRYLGPQRPDSPAVLEVDQFQAFIALSGSNRGGLAIASLASLRSRVEAALCLAPVELAGR